jgi:hypothetical protein
MSLFDIRAARLRHRRCVGGAAADVFDNIYSDKARRGQESVSGRGSDLNQTQALREESLAALRDLKVGILLDVPCGDFNWMRQIMEADPRLPDGSAAVIGSVLTTAAKIA